MDTVLVLVFLLVAVVFLFYFCIRQQRERIPNIIWTYWDSDPLPPFIEQCISTWYEHNPDFEIHVLNKNNLHEFLSKKEIRDIETWKYNDSNQRFSDLVRLTVLPKYGGVWLDASIVCYESFNWIHEENSECLVYSIKELAPPEAPMLESWFIACTKGNEFVSAWRDEFVRVQDFDSIDDYVETSCKNVDMSGINYPDYLLVYVCAKKIHRDLKDHVKLLDASAGPYSYHAQGGLDALCVVKKPKFFKFRKEDRANLTERQKECVFT